MRTAVTLFRGKAGWYLKYGPDKPADDQRKEFAGMRFNFPKDVTAVRFQMSDRIAREIDVVKAAQLEAAEKAAENARLETEAKAAAAKAKTKSKPTQP